MSAFEEARARAAQSPATDRRRGAGAAATATSSSASAAGSSVGVGASLSYQGGDAAYVTLISQVEKDLKKLNVAIAAIRKGTETLGTRAEAADTRSKITANVQKGKEVVRTVGNALRVDFAAHLERADASGREGATKRTQHSRFMADYKEAVAAFTEVANAAAAAERRYPPPSADSGAGSSKGKGDSEEDRMLASMQQMDLSESLMSEREAQIDDIAAAVVEVNEVFRDLAQLVDKQGEDIDRMEVNVSDAKDKTESGVDHLNKAAEYQKRTRTLIIVIIAVILVLAGGIVGFFLITKKV